MRKNSLFVFSVLVRLKFDPLALLLTGAIAIFLGLVGSHSAVQATQVENDYFSPTRDNGLLQTIQRYHLSREKFFLYYKEGIATGEFSRAIDELKFILRYYPNHPRALVFLASIAQMKKDFNLADQHYRKALSLYPQHALTHAQYGHFLLEAGQLDSGVAHLNQAIELKEQLAIAYEWLANAYDRQGDSQKAKEVRKKFEHWRKSGEDKE
jgi:predicted Zn-dependent protease